MKTSLFISLAFLATARLAFTQGASDDFPIHVGDYWVQHTDTLFGEYRPTTFRKEIEGTDLILGEEYARGGNWLTADDGSLESSWYGWFRGDSTGIVLGAFGDTSIIDSATIYDPPLPWLPNGIVNVGYTWEFDFPEAGGHYMFSVESISETVQVPVGTFNDCIKIRVMVTDAMGDTTRIGYYYYAQDVGDILNTTVFPENQIFRFELVEYSVLTSIDVDGITEIPAYFHLQQNYPNPFNPSTIILYSIPKSDFVTLKIYDMLGREIQTLVSEFQKVDTYPINFDASKLSSGIYFYQLQVGDFVETKKMILMR